MEEDIEEITHFSSSPKESTSDSVPAIPVENKPPSATSSSSQEVLTLEPQKWVKQF